MQFHNYEQLVLVIKSLRFSKNVSRIFNLTFWPYILFLQATLTSMRRELQSQNRINGDYEKTTGPIHLKFWQEFLLISTTEIQK